MMNFSCEGAIKRVSSYLKIIKGTNTYNISYDRPDTTVWLKNNLNLEFLEAFRSQSIQRCIKLDLELYNLMFTLNTNEQN